MSWDNPTSYAFSMVSVTLNAPEQSGVYALRDETTWIYVGESENIRAQLIQHLNGHNACVAMHTTLTFSYELLPPALRALRQDELIREFRPICNPRLG